MSLDGCQSSAIASGSGYRVGKKEGQGNLYDVLLEHHSCLSFAGSQSPVPSELQGWLSL